MAKLVVALLNRSCCVEDAAVAALLPALQKQVSEHLVGAWGSAVDVDLIFVEDRNARPEAWAWLLLLDDSDQAGALGYHDFTPAGGPLGKAFVRTDLDYGEAWQRTVSHELLELLIDPLCIGRRSVLYCGREVLTAVEVCDPVESDACGYAIDGQPVSDFVFPTYYDTVTQHAAGTRFDQTGALSAPMTIAAGGYVAIDDPADGTGWKVEFGQHVPKHKRLAPAGSRRERLLVGHRRWKPSTAA
jgi:hypothetical protein